MMVMGCVKLCDFEVSGRHTTHCTTAGYPALGERVWIEAIAGCDESGSTMVFYPVRVDGGRTAALDFDPRYYHWRFESPLEKAERELNETLERLRMPADVKRGDR